MIDTFYDFALLHDDSRQADIFVQQFHKQKIQLKIYFISFTSFVFISFLKVK